jgi:hypothetical protein
MAYDTEDIRKAKEDGWFKQNEAAMIESARKKREAAEQAQKSEAAEARRQAHWRKCPKCGADMRVEKIGNVEVEKCPDCEGIFFDRGELESLMMRHEGEKRGFFRKLLGFSEGGEGS